MFPSDRSYIAPFVTAEFVDSTRANELERGQQQSREVVAEEMGEESVEFPTVTASTVTGEAQVFVVAEDQHLHASQAGTSPREPTDTGTSNRKPRCSPCKAICRCCSPSEAIDAIVDLAKRRPIPFAIFLSVAALGSGFVATFMIVLFTNTSDLTTAPTLAPTTAPA